MPRLLVDDRPMVALGDHAVVADHARVERVGEDLRDRALMPFAVARWYAVADQTPRYRVLRCASATLGEDSSHDGCLGRVRHTLAVCGLITVGGSAVRATEPGSCLRDGADSLRKNARRAVVAAELKVQYGLSDTDLPHVRYGGVAINPDSLGLGGSGPVTQDDLDWPRHSPA
jgi:hypothetical protein